MQGSRSGTPADSGPNVRNGVPLFLRPGVGGTRGFGWFLCAILRPAGLVWGVWLCVFLFSQLVVGLHLGLTRWLAAGHRVIVCTLSLLVKGSYYLVSAPCRTRDGSKRETA